MRNADTIRTALLRRKEVEARTGLPRSSIYALIAKKEFPAPVNLTTRAVAWPSDAVDAWIAERIASAKKASA
jgi:prophage regulatory protein